MDPACVSTALGNRCYARVFLNVCRAGKALALLSEGDQQARRQLWAGTRQRFEQRLVRQGRRNFGDLRIEAIDGPQRDSQLFDHDHDQCL